MPQTDFRFRHYRNSFPSQEFILKHCTEFPRAVIHEGPYRMELDVRERLQRTFDNVLRRQAARLLIDQYERYGTIEPVFVFRSYEPEPWVITTLAQRKIPETKFIPAAKALCVEFIAHHQSGAWPQSPWRRWQATNDSIWLEVIPQAVLEGKHHSNSLRDLMHEPDV